MVGLINLGAGLSALGQSVAGSAMMAEKNDLDNQKLALASELTEGRESRLAGVQYGYQSKLAGQQQTFETGLEAQKERAAQTLESGREASEENIATGEEAARHSDILSQIGAEGWGIQFDQDTGNPIRVNAITGKTSPLVGADGKPLSVINTALMPVVKETVTGINQERQANIQAFNNTLNSFIGERQSAMNSVTATTPEAKAAAAKPYDDQIAALKKEHVGDLSAFANRTAQAIAPLYAKNSGGTKAPPPPPKGFRVVTPSQNGQGP